jgi:hypothetical protein
MYAVLEALRDALAVIDCVTTCKIGIEKNISPASYPMIRVVPTRILPGKPYNQRTADVQIYFGANVSESQGLESVYEELLTLEAEIIKVIKAEGGRYIDTITDEDRLDTYKLMVVRLEIEAARPAVT